MIRVLYRAEMKKDKGGELVDLAFYDANKKLIFKTYSFDTSKKEANVDECLVELEEDERVFGFTSRQPEMEPGYHFDFRFKIAKIK